MDFFSKTKTGPPHWLAIFHHTPSGLFRKRSFLLPRTPLPPAAGWTFVPLLAVSVLSEVPPLVYQALPPQKEVFLVAGSFPLHGRLGWHSSGPGARSSVFRSTFPFEDSVSDRAGTFFFFMFLTFPLFFLGCILPPSLLLRQLDRSSALDFGLGLVSPQGSVFPLRLPPSPCHE